MLCTDPVTCTIVNHVSVQAGLHCVFEATVVGSCRVRIALVHRNDSYLTLRRVATRLSIHTACDSPESRRRSDDLKRESPLSTSFQLLFFGRPRGGVSKDGQRPFATWCAALIRLIGGFGSCRVFVL